jgi:hypothetical protein
VQDTRWILRLVAGLLMVALCGACATSGDRLEAVAGRTVHTGAAGPSPLLPSAARSMHADREVQEATGAPYPCRKHISPLRLVASNVGSSLADIRGPRFLHGGAASGGARPQPRARTDSGLVRAQHRSWNPDGSGAARGPGFGCHHRRAQRSGSSPLRVRAHGMGRVAVMREGVRGCHRPLQACVPRARLRGRGCAHLRWVSGHSGRLIIGCLAVGGVGNRPSPAGVSWVCR